MKNLVINGFNKDKVPDLIDNAQLIVASMTTHVAEFPTPLPTLAVVQDGIDELSAAATEAQTGDRMKIATRNLKKSALVSLLSQLGVFVNLKANGVRYIAGLSGFTLREISKHQVIAPTVAPTAQLGERRGWINAQLLHQKAIKTFLWYYTTDATKPFEQWELITGENAQVIIKDLTPGVTYYILVELLGSRKQRVVSPITTIIA